MAQARKFLRKIIIIIMNGGWSIIHFSISSSSSMLEASSELELAAT